MHPFLMVAPTLSTSRYMVAEATLHLVILVRSYYVFFQLSFRGKYGLTLVTGGRNSLLASPFEMKFTQCRIFKYPDLKEKINWITNLKSSLKLMTKNELIYRKALLGEGYIRINTRIVSNTDLAGYPANIFFS